MPPKGHTELAHAQAADWVMGTLVPSEAVGFRLHLRDCPHCQAAVAEFRQLGQVLQHLPPAAEPPPALEARTIASVLAAAAEDQTPTRVRQIPAGLEAAAEDGAATEADRQPGGMAKVIRFPRLPGRAGMLAIAGAVAAAIIAAVLILPGLGSGVPRGAFAFTLVPPPGSGLAASGTAVARQDASGSWDVTLTVHHLKSFDDEPWYECWYLSRDGRHAASAGTFLVPSSGNGTFTMTSAADPRTFQTMEITLQSSGNGGALQHTVVLSGTAKEQ
jgi:hypothetical protein